MKDIDLVKLEKLYSDNLNENGFNSKSVGWTTEEGQILRFDKLTNMILDKEKTFSVNDYGCGFGSYLKYLEEREFKVKKFNGYDISQEMLSHFLEFNKETRSELNLKNESSMDTLADYSTVSGTFNVKFESGESNWEEFIKSKLEEMNKYSKQGFSFNMLSTYVDWQEPHLYYGNPTSWFKFCKTNFSNKVSLFHDYDLYEWTIIVIK